MSVNVTIAGVVFAFPTDGEENWGNVVTTWAQAVSSQLLQRTGGSFSLTAEVDFGATFGTMQAYLKSRTSNIATAGLVRMARTDVIDWRNQANSANLPLGVDSSNNLTFNGNIVGPSSGVLPVAQGGTGISSFTAGDTLYASGTTTLSKLGIGSANFLYSSSGSAPQWALLVNANVDAAAAIAYSKLALSGSIVNADINASAAIAYSKLALTGSIVNADINASAAIVRSKLASGTNYRILANSSSGVMSENAAITAANVVFADANGQLSGEATLATSRGGTNLASFTTGDILYASSSSVLSKLGIGSTGQVIKVAAGLPSWAAGSASLVTSTKVFSDSPVTISNAVDVYDFDTSSGAIAATLPDCATNAGKVFYFKKTTSDFNAVTINRAGSDSIIDAGASVSSTTLNTIGEEFSLISFGSTVWQVINRRIPSVTVSYTPTGAWSTNTTYTGFWSRIGDKILVTGTVTTSGAPTSATLSVNIPSGLTVDTAKINSTLTNATPVQIGNSVIRHAGTQTYVGITRYSTTTAVLIAYMSVTGSIIEPDSITQAAPFTWGNTDECSFEFTVPVSGWNG